MFIVNPEIWGRINDHLFLLHETMDENLKGSINQS